MKYTKGHWDFSKEECAIKYAINNDKNVHVAMVSCYVDGWVNNDLTEKYNNAVLVSAAPEMYEALKEWEKHINICNGVNEDSDEGFTLMMESRTKAIEMMNVALNKINNNKKGS